MVRNGPLAYLHENQCAVTRLHDKINLATPAPRRPIIAFQQPQAGRLQMLQGAHLGGIAGLPGRLRAGRCRSFGEHH